MKKYKSKIWYRGPFGFYRCVTGSLDIFLKKFDNRPWGWEYGWKDPMRGQDTPWIDIRVGKLTLFYFEKFKEGAEIWFLGFWAVL